MTFEGKALSNRGVYNRIDGYLRRVAQFSPVLEDVLGRANITVVNSAPLKRGRTLADLEWEAIRQGRGTNPPRVYLVDDSDEGFAHAFYRDRVLELAEAISAKPEQIIILNQNEVFHSADGPEKNDARINQSVMNIQFHRALDHAVAMDRRNAKISLRPAHYDYRFLSLNNVPRSHRIALASLMKSSDLMRHTAMSFHFVVRRSDKGTDFHLREALYAFPRHRGSIEQFIEQTEFPLALESEEYRQNFWGLPPVSNRCEWYLVTETNFQSFFRYHPVRRVTEKTMKALVFGRPFIILGEPWSLRYLRELGFSTYDELIDESYDDVLDSNERLESVVALLKEIAESRISRSRLRMMRRIGRMNREWLLGGFRNHVIARESVSLTEALARAGL